MYKKNNKNQHYQHKHLKFKVCGTQSIPLYKNTGSTPPGTGKKKYICGRFFNTYKLNTPCVASFCSAC